MASLAEPRVPKVTRARLPLGAPRRVLVLSLAWALCAATLGVILTVLPPLSAGIAFALCLASGLPLVAPRRLQGVGGVLLVAALTAGAEFLGLSPVLTAGAALGVILVGLYQGFGLSSAMQGAFAGSLLATLGARLGLALTPDALPALGQAAILGLGAGATAAQLLWLCSIEWLSVVRAPPPRMVRATLPKEHQEPSIKAWELDQALAAQTSELETRDGLGEVAAWVYRLSWTQAALSRELMNIDAERLGARLGEARKAAAEAGDALTREPREATVRHLEQLSAHRDALILEQQRTGALIEYALAFLEQARAGLALARVRPGEGMPERLGDVLTRLRSQTAEGDARRQTARQLTPLA